MNKQSSRSRLRWYQFSLRSLFLLMFVVSIGMSWFGIRLRASWRQRDAIKNLEDVCVFVSYASSIDQAPTSLKDDEFIWPRWLRQLLGDDFFVDVTKVYVFEGEIPFAKLQQFSDLRGLETVEWGGCRLNIEQLSALTCIPNLRTLDLTWAKDLTDASLQGIENSMQLEAVMLPSKSEGSSITDAGLAILGKMRNLRYLSLSDTSISDSGLNELKDLSKLEYLDLSFTAIGDAGLKSLGCNRRFALGCTV